MKFTSFDENCMRLALNEAHAAYAAGEIPVGCVIADAEGVISGAHNECEASDDVCAHAEILALRRAGRRALRGATLYVTLEPCPMCAGAIALSGLKRVVYGAADKKYGCCGSVYRITEDAAFGGFCLSDGGCLETECAELLGKCFSDMRTGRTSSEARGNEP